jgi:hypothetical protein
MASVLSLTDISNQNQFKVDYPYYGLFGSADVTRIRNSAEVLFKCKLLNGNIILLKKLVQPGRWIDANLDLETPLSIVIGTSIDDFLKNA